MEQMLANPDLIPSRVRDRHRVGWRSSQDRDAPLCATGDGHEPQSPRHDRETADTRPARAGRRNWAPVLTRVLAHQLSGVRSVLQFRIPSRNKHSDNAKS